MKKRVSFNIDEQLYEDLKAAAKERCVHPSLIIQRAILDWLDAPPTITSPHVTPPPVVVPNAWPVPYWQNPFICSDDSITTGEAVQG